MDNVASSQFPAIEKKVKVVDYTARNEAIKKRRRLVSKQLLKRVRPSVQNFCSQLNAERIVSYKSQHPIMPFVGSCYNRELKKIYDEVERSEKTKNLKRFAPELFKSINDAAELRAMDDLLCKDEACELGIAGKVAGSDDRKKQRIHVLSSRSKAKIRAKVTEFFAVCRRIKRQCTFLTLTFISEVSDRLAIKILNKFLTSIRQEVGDGFEYIRIAERQLNNETYVDNIHFHLILDRPINVVRFNSLWVVAQYNAGLVGVSKKLGRVMYKDEILSMHENTMKLYQQYKKLRTLRKWADAEKVFEEIKRTAIGKYFNPVNIKKVSHPGTLAGYLTKYVTKNDSSFQCSAWSCSRGVSRLFTGAMVPYKVSQEASSEVNSYISKDGELVMPVPYIDEKGMSVSIRIYNRDHFAQYLAEMRTVNVWIMKKEIDLPGVERYTLDEYVTHIHNRN